MFEKCIFDLDGGERFPLLCYEYCAVSSYKTASVQKICSPL